MKAGLGAIFRFSKEHRLPDRKTAGSASLLGDPAWPVYHTNHDFRKPSMTGSVGLEDAFIMCTQKRHAYTCFMRTQIYHFSGCTCSMVGTAIINENASRASDLKITKQKYNINTAFSP